MKIYKSFFVLITMLLSGFAFAAGNKIALQTEVASIDVHGNVNLAIKGSDFLTKGFSASDIVTVKVDSYKFTAPIVKNYSDVDTGETLVRLNGEEISIATNMGNFSKNSGAKVGSKVQITLKEHYGYLLTYQTRMLKKSNERNKFASDEIFANFRELKLGKIAGSKLYRSYSPIEQDERAPFAAKLAKENKISCVLNLADSTKTCEERAKNVPYYKNLYDGKKVLCANMGASFNTEEFSNKLKQVLLFIAENPGERYLIHGKEGKNRTGFVSTVLLALNGATIEEITEDYMKSFENLYGISKDFQKYGLLGSAVPYMLSIMSDGKKVTDKNLQTVVQNYLMNTVGLTKAQIDSVCANLN
ncbi:MAG: SAM-dependent chlorinase/fluorinase [Treponema sp.]|nr:SAM-dependent chlorinase/fluorinase [Treponema sp.]